MCLTALVRAALVAALWTSPVFAESVCCPSEDRIISAAIEYYIAEQQSPLYFPNPASRNQVIEFRTFASAEELLAAVPNCCHLDVTYGDGATQEVQDKYDFWATVHIDPAMTPVSPANPNPLAGKTWRVVMNSCGEPILPLMSR